MSGAAKSDLGDVENTGPSNVPMDEVVAASGFNPTEEELNRSEDDRESLRSMSVASRGGAATESGRATPAMDDSEDDLDDEDQVRAPLAGGTHRPSAVLHETWKRTRAAIAGNKEVAGVGFLLLVVVIAALIAVKHSDSPASQPTAGHDSLNSEEAAKPTRKPSQAPKETLPPMPAGNNPAAYGVIQRLLPQHAHLFDLYLVNRSSIEADGTAKGVPPDFTDREADVKAKYHDQFAGMADIFTVETYLAKGGAFPLRRIRVNGTSPVALSAGAYWYLKRVAGAQVTWGQERTGMQLKLPSPYLIGGEQLPPLENFHLRGVPRKEDVDSIPTDCPTSASHDDNAGHSNPFDHPPAPFFGPPKSDRTVHTDASFPAVFRSTVPIRYGWNMCTFSYSAAFWDEARWEKEIDWMALHGVNAPLAFTGQEAVWLALFNRHYNVSLEEMQSWLTGPAFLAWQRAGNIRGFAGPLPLDFIEGQRKLQVFILQRMRSLGMKPILTCFSGHLPQSVAEANPNAKITRSESWNHFPDNETRVYFLDPTDPLFRTIGRQFIEIQTELFGTDHWYNCDTFNELDPKTNEHSYLRDAGAAVYEGIKDADPEGLWVLQGWLFSFDFWKYGGNIKAYLSGVPDDRLLVLDLHSEDGALAPKHGDYFGKPWVWNLLHNFGGFRGMYGNLDEVGTKPFDSMYDGNGRTNMVGIGFTPEAIEQNPVMYELLTDTFWYPYRSAKEVDCRKKKSGGGGGFGATHNAGTAALTTQKIGLKTNLWLKEYVRQRYAVGNNKAVESAALQAWDDLVDAVYNQRGHPRGEIFWQPNFPSASYGWTNGDKAAMIDSLQSMLGLGNVLGDEAYTLGTYQYDLVDTALQATTMFFSSAHHSMDDTIARFAHGDVTAETADSILVHSRLLKSLVSGIYKLLTTNINFHLHRVWLGPAEQLAGSDPEIKSRFVFNAINQVTLWGLDGEIQDYAAKAWTGLFKGYYGARWNALFDRLEKVVQESLNGHKKPLKCLTYYDPQCDIKEWWGWDEYQKELWAVEIAFNRKTSDAEVMLMQAWDRVEEVENLLVNDAQPPAQSLLNLIRMPDDEVDLLFEVLNGNVTLHRGYTNDGEMAIQGPLRDAGALAKLCDLQPKCVAFDPDGSRLLLGSGHSIGKRPDWDKSSVYIHRTRYAKFNGNGKDNGDSGLPPQGPPPTPVPGDQGHIPVNGKDGNSAHPKPQRSFAKTERTSHRRD